MNNRISNKDKIDWHNFINSKEKLPNKDLKNNKKKIINTKSLDLHGYSLEDANKKIYEFINYCYENKVKKIVVITGTGLRSKNLSDPYQSKDLSILKYSVPEFIKSNDQPVNALRKLKKSSIRLATNDVKNKISDGLVSAGNTGALMAISKFVLKTVKTIDRPAISGLMPTMKGLTVVLDLGANVECSDDNLVQFALMGDIFAQCVLGIKKPKIGLLNVGSEDIKGNSVVKQAYENLKRIEKQINFYGFVEPSVATMLAN